MAAARSPCVATRIYCEAEDVENVARELSSRPRGLIRLAVPMSFGLRWVAPILPSFFRLYPEVAVDLHLNDAVVDLVGDGFDAALRIAVLPDSSLVARKLCAVAPFIVAAPAYLAEHGRPTHPRELDGHHCLGYAYRPRQDIWRFSNAAGAEETVTPTGPLRVTNVDALIPTVLDGIGITTGVHRGRISHRRPHGSDPNGLDAPKRRTLLRYSLSTRASGQGRGIGGFLGRTTVRARLGCVAPKVKQYSALMKPDSKLYRILFFHRLNRWISKAPAKMNSPATISCDFRRAAIRRRLNYKAISIT